MKILAVETSCDETSVAVVSHGTVLSNIVSSQAQLHLEYGGVVPELATREHLRNLLPVARAALAAAGLNPAALDAVAATRGPGLPSALMIGFAAAQSCAFALGKPFYGLHHHEAHLYSPWIWGDPPSSQFSEFQPNISLVVSGGHTLLVHVRRELEHTVLGSTLDDAAGECFDKIAKLLGLPYPGGPEIDRLASAGNPKAHAFPRPLLNEPSDDFSFSGLKTAVRYFLRDNPALLDDVAAIKNLCASAQAAIVEVLVAKTIRAAERLAVTCVTASGGVTCNSAFRRQLTEACNKKSITLRMASRTFCTDNAAMIGILAERKLLRGVSPTPPDADIAPNWPL
jgi:N6-L-threonylcarbamoyladenine synthase